ncbi:hypothetical protein Clacol_002427 [Clathrus columnatus]|uniref:ATP-dependent RNA helicase n=1 Tax=Clathrus columnatus TaxID=1419009 RepID=A0AAV5A6F6_9AGAM|nr:hypothetical protein Clacol_002427 [Clathrus columnatus]
MADKTQSISTGMNNQPNGAGNTAKPVASSAPASFAPFFRRRTLGRGRAPSPPTWACYEQIPLEFTDSEEGDDDEDEDDEEDEDDDIETDSDERSVSGVEPTFKSVKTRPDSPYAMDMDIDEPEHDNAQAGVDELSGIDVDGNSRIRLASDDPNTNSDPDTKHIRGGVDDGHCADECGCDVSETQKKQDKGKQRAVEVISPTNDNEKSEEKSPKKGSGSRGRKRRERESNQVLRPILTIKKSEGFVWNQELFIPSYIKDRYIASTSPPSNFASSTSSGVMGYDFNDNYEIEVVEIRVQGNELEKSDHLGRTSHICLEESMLVHLSAQRVPSATIFSSKTKAKEHYLKAKRQRRKKRLKSAAAVSDAARKAKAKEKINVKRLEDDKHERIDEELSGEEGDDVEIEDEAGEETRIKTIEEQMPIDVKQHPDDDNDSLDSDSSQSNSDSEHDSNLDVMSTTSDKKLDQKPSANVSGLRPFTMPQVTQQASQKELALQGLDPALVDAELVDSTKTIPVDSFSSDSDPPMKNPGSISSKMRKRLQNLGITEFFAVQTALLPFLLPSSPLERELYMPYNPPRDVCVSAPTGSGKTLAYAIPVIELLASRVVTRLRALVVLPTRDLVTQVRETFEALAKGRGLKASSCISGQHSFTHEQAQLVDESKVLLEGGSSKVDILICTPGRLIDHLKGTRNFTLQHLRFLVMDEADRLLTQSFQDWLAQVLAAIRPPVSSTSTGGLNTITTHTDSPQTFVMHHDAVSPAWQPIPSWRTHFYEQPEVSCQKLLFSATLTRDPAKIAAVELRKAKYFVVSDKIKAGEGGHLMGETFAFPPGLREHMLVTTTERKPLMLFYLLHQQNVTNALVFTNSAESTERLVKLFECFEDAWIGSLGEKTMSRPVARAYSSELNPADRKTILEDFKAQKISLLICSDLISRGIDISHVSHVISYDAPADITKYVHRVGRTARAGREGDAWCLLEKQEARYFKKMMTGANRLDRIQKLKVKEEELKRTDEVYAEMGKVNYMGGKLSVARTCSKDVSSRIQRRHFGQQRLRTLSECLQAINNPSASIISDPISGIRLAHAQRMARHEPGSDSSVSGQNYRSYIPPPSRVSSESSEDKDTKRKLSAKLKASRMLVELARVDQYQRKRILETPDLANLSGIRRRIEASQQYSSSRARVPQLRANSSDEESERVTALSDASVSDVFSYTNVSEVVYQDSIGSWDESNIPDRGTSSVSPVCSFSESPVARLLSDQDTDRLRPEMNADINDNGSDKENIYPGSEGQLLTSDSVILRGEQRRISCVPSKMTTAGTVGFDPNAISMSDEWIAFSNMLDTNLYRHKVLENRGELYLPKGIFILQDSALGLDYHVLPHLFSERSLQLSDTAIDSVPSLPVHIENVPPPLAYSAPNSPMPASPAQLAIAQNVNAHSDLSSILLGKISSPLGLIRSNPIQSALINSNHPMSKKNSNSYQDDPHDSRTQWDQLMDELLESASSLSSKPNRSNPHLHTSHDHLIRSPESKSPSESFLFQPLEMTPSDNQSTEPLNDVDKPMRTYFAQPLMNPQFADETRDGQRFLTGPLSRRRPQSTRDLLTQQTFTLSAGKAFPSKPGISRPHSQDPSSAPSSSSTTFSKGPNFPDIIFLQEVASSVRQSLLSNAKVRSSFLTTDAEDDTAFKKVPFATMTLLSNKRFGSSSFTEQDGGKGKGEGGSKVVLDSVFRTELPSRYRRDALCVNIRHPTAPNTILRLLNVHLDSLDSQFRRTLQMQVLADLLREPECNGGIIAGDFNAIYPNDYTLVDKHELVDAWVALHGKTTGSGGGATWGVGVELNDGLKPGRLDKVVMLGLQPNKVEVLQPGLIDGYTPWSDHCGLQCTFTVPTFIYEPSLLGKRAQRGRELAGSRSVSSDRDTIASPDILTSLGFDSDTTLIEPASSASDAKDDVDQG